MLVYGITDHEPMIINMDHICSIQVDSSISNPGVLFLFPDNEYFRFDYSTENRAKEVLSEMAISIEIGNTVLYFMPIE